MLCSTPPPDTSSALSLRSTPPAPQSRCRPACHFPVAGSTFYTSGAASASLPPPPQDAQQRSHATTRRALLLVPASAAAFSTFCNAATAAIARGSSSSSSGNQSLFDRVTSPTAQLFSPGNSLLGVSPLQYPDWLFGEWQVASRLSSFAAPLGDRFADPGALQDARAAAAEEASAEGGQGAALQYRQRFYSTLPDTRANSLRVALGLLPEGAVFADRAYNTRQSTDAVLGYDAVETVEYDPRKPGSETVTFARLGPDLRPLPPRRIVLYINRASSASRVDDDGHEHFVTSELFRQVDMGVRQVGVRDFEVLTLYSQGPPGRVEALQRVAAYLQPQDALYFQAANRAVAVYDYTQELTRALPPLNAPVGAKFCVLTPKQFLQCIG